MKISEEVLGLSVIIFTVICLTLLAVIRMFIYSKPAGRRMVTSNIHAIQTASIQMVVLSVSLGSISRAFLGPLSFWPAFVFTEMFKVTLAFSFGLCNVSAFLQMAIITNISGVQQLPDSRIIFSSVTVALLHLGTNLREYILMYQGELPMLTKGPFALFYSGEQIVNQLSKKSPGRGIPVLLIGSLIFQISLYILKTSKSKKLGMYTHNLTRYLVENVLNMYGIKVIIIMSLISAVYSILHHWSIELYKISENPPQCVPTEIIILFVIILFSTVVPFIKSYALREFAVKKVKGFILNIPLSKLKCLKKENTVAAMESGQSFRKMTGNGRRLKLLARNRKEIYSNDPVEMRMERTTSARKLGEGLTKEQRAEEIHKILNIKKRSKYEDVDLPDVQI